MRGLPTARFRTIQVHPKDLPVLPWQPQRAVRWLNGFRGEPMPDVRRRELIALLGGAAAAWPLMARAQQSAMPVIGFLRSTSLADATHLVVAFRQGLKEAGFVEGQNVVVEYRSAENDRDRLHALVTEFVHRPVAVIVGNLIAALAAKAA